MSDELVTIKVELTPNELDRLLEVLEEWGTPKDGELWIKLTEARRLLPE
jgi:hypothetical protein